MSDVRCQMSVASEARVSSLTSDIWYLTSSSWRNYADTVARPALRRANVDEETRFHADCRDDAQPGHRREHGDLQRRPRGAAQAVALRGTGSTGHDLGAQSVARPGAEPGIARHLLRLA